MFHASKTAHHLWLGTAIAPVERLFVAALLLSVGCLEVGSGSGLSTGAGTASSTTGGLRATDAGTMVTDLHCEPSNFTFGWPSDAGMGVGSLFCNREYGELIPSNTALSVQFLPLGLECSVIPPPISVSSDGGDVLVYLMFECQVDPSVQMELMVETDTDGYDVVISRTHSSWIDGG